MLQDRRLQGWRDRGPRGLKRTRSRLPTERTTPFCPRANNNFGKAIRSFLPRRREAEIQGVEMTKAREPHAPAGRKESEIA